MADVKISALPASTTPLAGTEVLPIVQGTTTKKVAVSDLTAGRAVSAISYTPTGSTVPVNGVFLPATNAVGFATNSTERMRITSAGDVGIGTSNPLVKFQVKASTDYNGGFFETGGAFTFTAFNDAGTASIPLGINGSNLRLRTGGVDRMLIDATGIVTMSAYGAGAATFSASGVISSVSDETWKTKDGVPANPDEMLQKLKPGYWFYNEEKAPIFGADRQLGFYAQNVNEAIGNEAAPTPEEGKPWGYYDRSVLAITVMSLQNALQKIEELNEKFDAYVASHP